MKIANFIHLDYENFYLQFKYDFYMGNTNSTSHNIDVFVNVRRGDIIKIPRENGTTEYYLYTGDLSKLYNLNTKMKEHFCYPEASDEPGSTVSYQQVNDGLKCVRITADQWIRETTGTDIDVETYNRKKLQVLLPGDIAKIRSHRFLYIGNGEVVHLLSKRSSCDDFTEKHRKELSVLPGATALVTKDKYLDFAKKSKVYKSNKRDLIPLPSDKVIKRALRQLGPARYSAVTQNCVHFVDEMKYGRQVCKKLRSFCIGKECSYLADDEEDIDTPHHYDE